MRTVDLDSLPKSRSEERELGVSGSRGFGRSMGAFGGSGGELCGSRGEDSDNFDEEAFGDFRIPDVMVRYDVFAAAFYFVDSHLF